MTISQNFLPSSYSEKINRQIVIAQHNFYRDEATFYCIPGRMFKRSRIGPYCVALFIIKPRLMSTVEIAEQYYRA